MQKYQIDLNFVNKNLFRFLLIQQWGSVINNYQIPFFNKLFLFFKIYNIIDLDEVRTFIMPIFSDFFLVEKLLLQNMFQSFI